MTRAVIKPSIERTLPTIDVDGLALITGGIDFNRMVAAGNRAFPTGAKVGAAIGAPIGAGVGACASGTMTGNPVPGLALGAVVGGAAGAATGGAIAWLGAAVHDAVRGP